MKQERIIMGMTIIVEIADKKVDVKIFDEVFTYFENIDQKFSTYKTGSEISKINAGIIKDGDYSRDMQEIFTLAEQTKIETNGYFNIVTPKNIIDPSGIVKGWCIWQAGEILKKAGYKNFYINAGGDIEVSGVNNLGKPWKIGIRNPLKIEEVIKVLSASNIGVATSGSYVHKTHIYNPLDNEAANEEIVSLTVIGPNIYEADRFATAAFAMGRHGIYFIENFPGLEGYMIDNKGVATMTTGFEKYL